MPCLSRVVVGLDGSEAALVALRWAAERVDASGIDIVHAGAPDPVVPADISFRSVHSEDAPPADVLVEAAQETGADAIIVGPHGSGFALGLGRVARDLLSNATVPVLVIDDEDPPRALGDSPPVVACIGYGEPADAAASWAADYAEQRHLPLVLLHSVAYRPLFGVDDAADVLASYLGAGVSKEWALDELNKKAAELAATHPGVDITTHVEGASVIKAVQRAGESAELVVLGKRSDDEFLHALGTPRLRRLVARSNFPTAVVPCSTLDE